MTATNIAIIYWIVTAILSGFALIVLWRVYQTDLTCLICEPPDENGKVKASLSRFQFLLFTFIVASVWLTLCLESSTFIEIPNGVLGLIGISGGSFVVSKGIGKKTN